MRAEEFDRQVREFIDMVKSHLKTNCAAFTKSALPNDDPIRVTFIESEKGVSIDIFKSKEGAYVEIGT